MTEETKMHIEEVRKVYPGCQCRIISPDEPYPEFEIRFWHNSFCGYKLLGFSDINCPDAWRNAYNNLKKQPNGN